MIKAHWKESINKFCISINGGNIIPVITYKKEWNKLIRYVEKNHFLGKYRGYAIHKALLNLMKKRHGENMELVTIKSGTRGKRTERFSSRLKDWYKKGITINYSGEQLCLPVSCMRRIGEQPKAIGPEVDWEKERMEIVVKLNEPDPEKETPLFQIQENNWGTVRA